MTTSGTYGDAAHDTEVAQDEVVEGEDEQGGRAGGGEQGRARTRPSRARSRGSTVAEPALRL